MGVGLDKELRVLVAQKGMRPEHFRQYIKQYNENHTYRVKSNDWRLLLHKLQHSDALQVVGDVGSGKTHLVKQLIRNDKDHVFIVLDAHNEYDDLPVITQLSPDLKESSRIALPKMIDGSRPIFRMYVNLVTSNKFPPQYILVVEEALRYKKSGIYEIMAESRKFIKPVAVTQELLVTYVPHIQVEPFKV